jgi:hypothetical protein
VQSIHTLQSTYIAIFSYIITTIHALHKIKSAGVLQNKIVTYIHTLHKIKSAWILQNKIVTSIHYNLHT